MWWKENFFLSAKLAMFFFTTFSLLFIYKFCKTRKKSFDLVQNPEFKT